MNTVPIRKNSKSSPDRRNISQRSGWLGRFSVYAPLVFWIILILGLGSSFGAASETSRIIRPVLEFLFPTASHETLAFLHGFIRKLAHFVEYAVLGFLACRAFAPGKNWRFAAAALVVAVAASDELFQSVNPSRTGSRWDVALDVFGGVTAIFLYWALWFRGKPKRRARTRLSY